VHGDLHLANLCMFEGKPTAFDALEFDPRLATTDVLHDLAFLLMDLIHANRKREANTVMNSYWDEAQESEDSLRLLPFFMALRAAVRLAVAVPDGRLEHAASYRDLALYLLQNSVPKAIAIGGLSGTGKSSLAREVAPMLPGSAGARILRTDVIRKQVRSIAPETPAAASAYTTDQRMLIYERMVRQAREAASAGASIVLDATFQDEDARKLMDTGLARTQRFWLEAPLETRLARIGARTADASDASARVAIAQEHGATSPSDWVRLDARLPVEQLARRLVEHLA
jgi:predicted kinase